MQLKEKNVVKKLEKGLYLNQTQLGGRRLLGIFIMLFHIKTFTV